MGDTGNTAALALALLTMLLTGCSAGTGGQDPPAQDRPAQERSARERPDRPQPALSLGRSSTSSGRFPPLVSCVSHNSQAELTDVPKLLWVVLEVTKPVRLAGLRVGGQTRIESRTAWIGPDAGPDAPTSAVVVGEDPSAPRATYDTRLIGDRDRRDVTGVIRSWRGREPLRSGQRLAPGRHVLFVRFETDNLASFKGLALGWREPGGARQSAIIGGLKFVVVCGG